MNVAVIPARGGSERLKNKNILPFGNIPLLAHSIRYAQKHSQCIDRVVVSTENETIKEIAQFYGAEIIDRPPELATNYTPTAAVFQHVATCLPEAQYFFCLQPTNPLRPPDLLPQAFQALQTAQRKSLFTVSETHRKLGKIKDGIYVPQYVFGQRSQDLDPIYFENGLLYITHVDMVRAGMLSNADSLPYIVAHPYAFADIDTMEDFHYALHLASFERYVP